MNKYHLSPTHQSWIAACLFFFYAGTLLAQVASPVPDTYPVQVQTNVRVRMTDGVSLVADIYRPRTEGKFPVLLTQTPYNRKDPATGMYLAARG